MGAFNILKVKAPCPSCGAIAHFEIQFKYGRTWQIEYQLGNAIRWGGNDVGEASLEKVAVEAIGGPCPHCNEDFLEFDIIIEKNIIISVIPIKSPREFESESGYRPVAG